MSGHVQESCQSPNCVTMFPTIDQKPRVAITSSSIRNEFPDETPLFRPSAGAPSRKNRNKNKLRPKRKQQTGIRKKEEEDEDLAKQLEEIKKRLAEAEDRRKRDLEDAKFQYELEMEEQKERLQDQLGAVEPKKLGGESAKHQTLRDEFGKMIEFLRKENVKLHQQVNSMKREYKSLKEKNVGLMEANASASCSFNQLNEHARDLNAKNVRLLKNLDTYKKQLRNIKEDSKNCQNFYVAEAHARVVYQETFARIMAQVQDKSRDEQLVEDVVIWALECEAEAKAERAAAEDAMRTDDDSDEGDSDSE